MSNFDSIKFDSADNGDVNSVNNFDAKDDSRVAAAEVAAGADAVTRADAVTGPAAATAKAATANRLPYRAGAMILLAIAVVCLGLGWHSAVSKDGDSTEKLRNEVAQTSGIVAESSAATGTSKAEQTGDRPQLCVFNVGTIRGLASKTKKLLVTKGWDIPTSPRNLKTQSISENTIFYTEDQQEFLDQLVTDLDNGASKELRPDAFTECPGKIVVIVHD